jgi:hypothetical protein
VVTRDRLVGLRRYKFVVVIVVAGVGAAGGSLGACFAGGALLTCMQHSGNTAVEGSRGNKLGLK